MFVTRAVLTNYKQHAKLDVTFEGNIIGIVGKNGDGKSNLLGGMQYAFSGEQPGYKKSELVRWGSKSGSSEVYFTHDETEGYIRRDVPGAGAYFKFGDIEYEGASSVAEGIKLHMGLDKDLTRQTVFVRQAEIDSILFTDAGKRELAFQKLCGMGSAAKVYKKLGEVIGELERPQDYDAQLAEGRARHAEMTERIKGLKTQYDESKTQLEATAALEDLQAELNSQTVAKASAVRYRDVIRDITTTGSRLAEVEKLLKSYDIVAGLTADAFDTQITDTSDLLVKAQAYQAAMAEWQSTGDAVVSLGTAPAVTDPPVTQEQLNALGKAADTAQAKADTLTANIAMYVDIRRALGDNVKKGADCPVCGNTITDASRIDTLIQAYQQQLSDANPVPAQDAVGSALMEWSAYNDKVQHTKTVYETRHKAATEAHERAVTAISALAKVEATVEALTATLADLTSKRKKAVEDIAIVSQYTTEINLLKERMVNLNTEQVALHRQVEGIPGLVEFVENANLEEGLKQLDDTIATIQSQLTAIHELDKIMANLDGVINATHDQIEQLEKTISTLEFKRANQETYVSTLDTLTQVRDWFHYSNGPRTLSTAILSDMTDDVNEFLTQFAAPFSVTNTDESMGFQCIFHDGRPLPDGELPGAHVLSGGEKIQLAVSFRFASYCMFATRLGLLSLDEPTVYLDETKIGRFCTLLQKIKEVSKKMNLQVFMATHERAVIPFMDTVIDLSE